MISTLPCWKKAGSHKTFMDLHFKTAQKKKKKKIMTEFYLWTVPARFHVSFHVVFHVEQATRHITSLTVALDDIITVTYLLLYTLCDFHNLTNCSTHQTPDRSPCSLMTLCNVCLSCFMVIGGLQPLQQSLWYPFPAEIVLLVPSGSSAL